MADQDTDPNITNNVDDKDVTLAALKEGELQEEKAQPELDDEPQEPKPDENLQTETEQDAEPNEPETAANYKKPDVLATATETPYDISSSNSHKTEEDVRAATTTDKDNTFGDDDDYMHQHELDAKKHHDDEVVGSSSKADDEQQHLIHGNGKGLFAGKMGTNHDKEKSHLNEKEKNEKHESFLRQQAQNAYLQQMYDYADQLQAQLELEQAKLAAARQTLGGMHSRLDELNEHLNRYKDWYEWAKENPDKTTPEEKKAVEDYEKDLEEKEQLEQDIEDKKKDCDKAQRKIDGLQDSLDTIRQKIKTFSKDASYDALEFTNNALVAQKRLHTNAEIAVSINHNGVPHPVIHGEDGTYSIKTYTGDILPITDEKHLASIQEQIALPKAFADQTEIDRLENEYVRLLETYDKDRAKFEDELVTEELRLKHLQEALLEQRNEMAYLEQAMDTSNPAFDPLMFQLNQQRYEQLQQVSSEIEGIIPEQEKQVEYLKQVTTTFDTMKDTYIGYEMGLLSQEELTKTLEKHAPELAAAHESITNKDSMQAAFQQYVTDKNMSEQEIAELSAKLQSMTNELKEVGQERAFEERNLALLEKDMAKAEAQMEEDNQAIEELQQREEALNEMIERYRTVEAKSAELTERGISRTDYIQEMAGQNTLMFHASNLGSAVTFGHAGRYSEAETHVMINGEVIYQDDDGNFYTKDENDVQTKVENPEQILDIHEQMVLNGKPLGSETNYGSWKFWKSMSGGRDNELAHADINKLGETAKQAIADAEKEIIKLKADKESIRAEQARRAEAIKDGKKHIAELQEQETELAEGIENATGGAIKAEEVIEAVDPAPKYDESKDKLNTALNNKIDKNIISIDDFHDMIDGKSLEEKEYIVQQIERRGIKVSDPLNQQSPNIRYEAGLKTLGDMANMSMPKPDTNGAMSTASSQTVLKGHVEMTVDENGALMSSSMPAHREGSQISESFNANSAGAGNTTPETQPAPDEKPELEQTMAATPATGSAPM